MGSCNKGFYKGYMRDSSSGLPALKHSVFFSSAGKPDPWSGLCKWTSCCRNGHDQTGAFTIRIGISSNLCHNFHNKEPLRNSIIMNHSDIT